MRCRDFENWLEIWFQGEASETVAADCERHVGECSDCRDLLELLELAGVSDSVGPANDLTAAVLEATSGPACGQAAFRLADPDPTSDPALVAHLEACPDCRRLAATLEGLSGQLSSLRQIPVPAGFTEDVLRRTLPVGERFWRQLRRSWRRWLWRPRFAAELAYALTVLLVVAVGNPAAPLAAMSEQVGRLGSVVAAEGAGDGALAFQLDELQDAVRRSELARTLGDARSWVGARSAQAGESWQRAVDVLAGLDGD